MAVYGAFAYGAVGRLKATFLRLTKQATKVRSAGCVVAFVTLGLLLFCAVWAILALLLLLAVL